MGSNVGRLDGLDERPAGPAGGQVPCAGCGALLDPLRAGHVAILESQFRYFCDYAQCRPQFRGGEQLGVGPVPALGVASRPPAGHDPAELAAVALPVRGAEPSAAPVDLVPDRLIPGDGDELLEPIAEAPELGEAIGAVEAAERRDLGGVLLVLALLAGCLTVALELADQARLVLVSRSVLCIVGAGALAGRAFTTPSDAAEPRPAVAALPVVLASLFAPAAILLGRADAAARACFFGGVVVAVAAAAQWLLWFAARPVAAARRTLARHLDVAARRVPATGPLLTPEMTMDVRPGEIVAVEAGETVPVDLEVRDGEADTIPWLSASHRVKRRPGQYVVAGARVVAGQLRGTCTKAGVDRALGRSTLHADRRCDVHAPAARWSRAIAQRWAWLGGMAAGLVALVLGWGAADVLGIAMVVAAVWAALANGPVATMASLAIARGVTAAGTRGVVYEDGGCWTRAARVSAAVFCARGTLLRGEPELAEVEALSDGQSADELLGLAAGALVGLSDPMAVAVRRAARDRSLAPEPVRAARPTGGTGVTAIAPGGEPLTVGNRALLLERRVSMAAAEARVTELEASGRSVLLVGRGARLAGLLAFQDGLRPGARSAVQQLVESGIEPVLLSADARQTCEAIGRSLDIEHLRPEVADAERAETVRGLRETGAVVAVIGHAPIDDPALGAADVPVVLGGAGRPADDGCISLISDDVRDAALALALAHRTRRQAVHTLALVLGPALFGSLMAATRLLPPEYAPLALLVGTAAAVAHLRAWDRKLGPQ